LATDTIGLTETVLLCPALRPHHEDSIGEIKRRLAIESIGVSSKSESAILRECRVNQKFGSRSKFESRVVPDSCDSSHKLIINTAERFQIVIR
jgi:hypothetical protein